MTAAHNPLIRALDSLNYRNTYFVIFTGCTGLILVALYMQYQMGMPPCPLCISQRIFIIVVGLFALIAALHNPAATGRRIYSGLSIIAALIGGGVALRHVWIQNLPENQVPACGPGLQYMFDAFPLMDALSLLFQGDGNCADVSWQFLGLSMPAWVAVCFICLIAANIWQALRPCPTSTH